MSFREFVRAITKVDLNLQLTGSLVKDGLMMIARQNGIPAEVEDFEEWVSLLDAPDYSRLDEIAAVAGGWVKYPEDITRVVYDIGVSLHKQNIRYAEICVAPSAFVGAANMNFDVFISALNDGRDRARRAWDVDMSWVLCIPSDNPRAGDDVARWATSAAARSGNVVALGMMSREGEQPIGQFKRAYATAQKKGINTVANAGSELGAAGISSAMEELNPQRLTNSFGLETDDDLLNLVSSLEIPVILSISRALRLGKISRASDFPLRLLLDKGVNVVLSAGMPALYQASLEEEYVLAHEECGLSVEEIIELARRTIQLAYLDEERKQNLLNRFEESLLFARASLA